MTSRVYGMAPRNSFVWLGMAAMTSAISGCSLFPDLQTPYLEQNPLVVGIGKNRDDGKLKPPLERFRKNYYAAEANPDAKNIKLFLESGMAYYDLQCSEYFSRVDFTRAHREYAQKQTTLIGSMTSAVLGLADAGSAVTGASGAAFGFTSSSFDAYNSAFLASTDIGLLRNLVQSARANDKADTLSKITNGQPWPNGIDSFDAAVSTLDEYFIRCHPIGIRTLLKASIEDKTQILTSQSKQPKNAQAAGQSATVAADATPKKADPVKKRSTKHAAAKVTPAKTTQPAKKTAQ